MDLLVCKESIGIKWVSKAKFNEQGKVEKHKVRLVAKRCPQEPDIDYEETFSHVARLDIVRVVLAIAAQNQ